MWSAHTTTARFAEWGLSGAAMAKNKNITRTPEAPRVITARNYAAQVEKSLVGAIDTLTQKQHKDDALYTRLYLSMMGDAVHFVMPDTARLMNDGLSGLSGNVSKLPYPVMTVEYYSRSLEITADEPDRNIHKSNIDKVCILAVEHPSAVYDKKGFSVHAFGHGCGGWATMPIGLFVPEDATMASSSLDDFKIIGTLPDSCKKHYLNMSSAQKKTMLGGIIKIAALPVFELIEALSCRNVTTANHQEASPANDKRIKSGKLPIYETKMLVIDTKATETSSGVSGGSHASPRQHLRRGHIRRHPTAGNLWINSCVVGDPSKGVINKSYAVK